MSNFLDQGAPIQGAELVMDTKSKMIYDPRNFSLFQNYKYSQTFRNMRPDLSRGESVEWTEKFVMAEKVIVQLSLLQMRNISVFCSRFGDRYLYDLDDTVRQLRDIDATRLQLNEGTRVGPVEEVQAKINFFDKIMDKVNGYDMLYPLNEQSFKAEAHHASTDVRKRQETVKDRLLREMGVDYSLLK